VQIKARNIPGSAREKKPGKKLIYKKNERRHVREEKEKVIQKAMMQEGKKVAGGRALSEEKGGKRSNLHKRGPRHTAK